MEEIRKLEDLFIAFNIDHNDPRREDRLRDKLFDYGNTSVTVLPDSVGVRLVGWPRQEDEHSTVSYHRSLVYPFTRNDVYEAVDEMEEQICGTGFTL